MVEKSAALDYSFRQGVEMCQYRIRELEGELDAAVKRAEAAERYLAAARKLHPGTFAIIDHTIDVSDSRDALLARDSQIAALRKALEEHHKWLCSRGPIKIGDDQQGWHEIDDGAEYSDSAMYERTEAALASDDGAPLLAWIDRAAKALEPFADYAKYKENRGGKDLHIGYYSPSPMMSDCDRAAEVMRDKP